MYISHGRRLLCWLFVGLFFDWQSNFFRHSLDGKPFPWLLCILLHTKHDHSIFKISWIVWFMSMETRFKMLIMLTFYIKLWCEIIESTIWLIHKSFFFFCIGEHPAAMQTTNNHGVTSLSSLSPAGHVPVLLIVHVILLRHIFSIHFDTDNDLRW